MADLTITPGSVTADILASIDVGVSGATITAGQALYKDETDANKLKLADADVLASSIAAGISLNPATSGQLVNYIKAGTLNLGSGVTVGSVYGVSTTAGGIAAIGDLDIGDYVTVLGVGVSTTAIAVRVLPSKVLSQTPAGGGNALFTSGASVPADGSAGYATGLLFTDTTFGEVWINRGTSSSASFRLAFPIEAVTLANSTQLTTSGTETNLAEFTIPNRHLKPGTLIHLHFGVPSQGFTPDVLVMRCRLGTLSGPQLFALSWQHPQTGQNVVIADLIIRTVGNGANSDIRGTALSCSWTAGGFALGGGYPFADQIVGPGANQTIGSLYLYNTGGGVSGDNHNQNNTNCNLTGDALFIISADFDGSGVPSVSDTARLDGMRVTYSHARTTAITVN